MPQILFKHRTPPIDLAEIDKTKINKLIDNDNDTKNNNNYICNKDSLSYAFSRVKTKIDDLREYIEEKEIELYLNVNIDTFNKPKPTFSLSYVSPYKNVGLDQNDFIITKIDNGELISELNQNLISHKTSLKELKEIRDKLLNTSCAYNAMTGVYRDVTPDGVEINDADFDIKHLQFYQNRNKVSGGYKKRKTRKNKKKMKSYKSKSYKSKSYKARR